MVDGVTEVVVEDGPAELGDVEELQRLAVTQQLVERLRHRRQVQAGSLRCGVGEQALLGEDRLAGPGSPDHQRDRIQDEPAAEHLVETEVAGRETLHHDRADRRVSALDPTGLGPWTRTAAVRPAWPRTRSRQRPAPHRPGPVPTSPAPDGCRRWPAVRTAPTRHRTSSAPRSTGQGRRWVNRSSAIVGSNAEHTS